MSVFATYGLPKDYKVGFRVEDLEGKEVEFAVAEDGSFTVPNVTTETTYNVFVFGVKEGANTVKKKLQVTAIPANQLQTGWTNLSGKNGEERDTEVERLVAILNRKTKKASCELRDVLLYCLNAYACLLCRMLRMNSRLLCC